jgi:hypothetical protein
MSNVICYFITLPELCEKPVSLSGDSIENTASIKWQIPENIDGELLGYNIYRDEKKLNEQPIEDTEYLDENLEDGTYIYKVSAVYEHCDESELTDGVTVVIYTVGIEEIYSDSFKIYPNPANNSVVLKGDALYKAEIFDVQGHKLTEYNEINEQLQISVSTYNNGVYFVKMYSTTGTIATKQLVIIK